MYLYVCKCVYERQQIFATFALAHRIAKLINVMYTCGNVHVSFIDEDTAENALLHSVILNEIYPALGHFLGQPATCLLLFCYVRFLC